MSIDPIGEKWFSRKFLDKIIRAKNIIEKDTGEKDMLNSRPKKLVVSVTDESGKAMNKKISETTKGHGEPEGSNPPLMKSVVYEKVTASRGNDESEIAADQVRKGQDDVARWMAQVKEEIKTELVAELGLQLSKTGKVLGAKDGEVLAWETFVEKTAAEEAEAREAGSGWEIDWASREKIKSDFLHEIRERGAINWGRADYNGRIVDLGTNGADGRELFSGIGEDEPCYMSRAQDENFIGMLEHYKITLVSRAIAASASGGVGPEVGDGLVGLAGLVGSDGVRAVMDVVSRDAALIEMITSLDIMVIAAKAWQKHHRDDVKRPDIHSDEDNRRGGGVLGIKKEVSGGSGVAGGVAREGAKRGAAGDVREIARENFQMAFGGDTTEYEGQIGKNVAAQKVYDRLAVGMSGEKAGPVEQATMKAAEKVEMGVGPVDMAAVATATTEKKVWGGAIKEWLRGVGEKRALTGGIGAEELRGLMDEERKRVVDGTVDEKEAGRLVAAIRMSAEVGREELVEMMKGWGVKVR